MKKISLVLLAALASNLLSGQARYDFGEKFPFNDQEESNPKLVLVDNYNSYLLSTTLIDGMLSTHKITIRKFDQKNQLTDTYTQDFEKIDAGTLYRYLGTKEIDAQQVVVFAESYSGKEKKKDIYKYVFNKTTAKFTTSLVISYPIESLMRSGTTDFEISENGNYISLVNERNTKKDAVQDNVVMVDGNSLAVLWNKEVTLDEKYTDRAFTVTNSGKAILLRAAKGFRLSNYLIIVTQNGQEDKQFEENVMLHDPRAFSIGEADYIVDFDYNSKGLRYGDFDKIMLYDIGTGKTIKNSDITTFRTLKDISEIRFTKILAQDNEIYLFTEAKAKSGTRPARSPFTSMTTDEPVYRFGPSNLIVMGFDGEVKAVKNIFTDNSAIADFYHSFGVLNINGRYFINSNAEGIAQLYEQPLPSVDKSTAPSIITPIQSGDDPYKREAPKYVSQLSGYVKDARKVILCRVHFDNKMSLVSLTGFPQVK